MFPSLSYMLLADGVSFMRWLQAAPSTFLTKHTTCLPLVMGVNLRTNRQHQADIFLSETGCSSVTVISLLPSRLLVVSALLEGCNTTGSLPSTGSSEPGADEAADLASTLLPGADPATPLLVALGFPSKPLIVLLDDAERGIGKCGGRCMDRCAGVYLSSSTKRFHQRGTPRTKKDKKQKTSTKRTAGTFGTLFSVLCTFWAVSSIGCTV